MEPLNKIPRDYIRIGDTLVKEIIYNNETVYPIREPSGLKFIEWVYSSKSYVDNSLMSRSDIRPRTINIHVIMNIDLYRDNSTGNEHTFFGTRWKYNDGEYRVISGGSYNSDNSKIGINAWNYDGGYRYDLNNPYYNTHGFHKLEADGLNLKIDDVVIGTCRAGDNKYQNTINPWVVYSGKRMIKNTTMWVDGVKIYEYVAAKKDGIYGLYDLVGGEFYGDEYFIGSE